MRTWVLKLQNWCFHYFLERFAVELLKEHRLKLVEAHRVLADSWIRSMDVELKNSVRSLIDDFRSGREVTAEVGEVLKRIAELLEGFDATIREQNKLIADLAEEQREAAKRGLVAFNVANERISSLHSELHRIEREAKSRRLARKRTAKKKGRVRK